MKSLFLHLVATSARKAAFSLVLFLSATSITQALPFSNGSFEDTVVESHPPYLYKTFVNGNTIDGGWVVAGPVGGPYPLTAAVGVIRGDWFGALPTAGSQHLAFNVGGTVPGASISQTFDTVAGATYTVQFDVGYGSDYALNMELLAQAYSSGGALLNSVKGVTDYTSRYIKDVTFSFEAVGSSTTLRFSDTPIGTGVGDTMLDNVRVTGPAAPVPESGFTLGLLPLALVGLVVLRRKLTRT